MSEVGIADLKARLSEHLHSRLTGPRGGGRLDMRSVGRIRSHSASWSIGPVASGSLNQSVATEDAETWPRQDSKQGDGVT
jgi:hypothetical protein